MTASIIFTRSIFTLLHLYVILKDASKRYFLLNNDIEIDPLLVDLNLSTSGLDVF